MKPALLDYLVCTRCSSPLSLVPGWQWEDSSQQEIYCGVLSCKQCRREFPIERGVPRMVDEGLSSRIDINTGASFGIAWKQFPRMDERYRRQFFDWIAPADPSSFKGKLVLEAGCGKGRHAKIACESGAKAVFAVDIGDAVDIAYCNVGRLPGIHVIQADIENLPFKAIFDFAFSVGVLHHMEHPQDGFISMCRKLKDDGTICVWVYGQENNWWLINLINPVRIHFTSKLPASELQVISGALALVVWLAAKLIFGPWAKLQNHFRRLPSLYYQKYLSYIAEFDFIEIHHIVFDHLVTPIACYVSQEDFRNWFKNADLSEPAVRWHNENSWAGVCSKQAAVIQVMQAEAQSQVER